MADTDHPRRRHILFAIIAMLLPLVVIEAGARITIAILSASALPLIYGLDGDIGLQIRDLGDLDMVAFRDGGGFRDAPEPVVLPTKSAEETLVVWAFGGSTTAGDNCGSDSSSWPNELGALMPTWRVTNFGRDGSNSDFAYRTLLGKLAETTPDLVLWANRVNETDVLSLGADRNADRLAATAADSSVGRARLWIERLSLTLGEISVTYFLASDVGGRIAWKLGVRGAQSREWTTADYRYAAMNYSLNSTDVLALAGRLGFRVGLVALANKAEVVGGPQNTVWDQIFVEAQRQLALQPGAIWIDTRNAPELRGAGVAAGALFCDGVHQTRLGNRLTAAAVLEALRLVPPMPE